MSAWQTGREEWVSWIDADAHADRPVWVSCDEFDEDLRTMLERSPFLGGLDQTSVTMSAEAVAQPGRRSPAGFDSMTTLVRPSPLEDEHEDTVAGNVAEAAQTQVRGRVSDELEVGIAMPETGLEVGLDSGGAEPVEGLFIPKLRAPADATQGVPPPPPSAAFAQSPEGPPMHPPAGGTVIAEHAPTADDVRAYAEQQGYNTTGAQRYAPASVGTHPPVTPGYVDVPPAVASEPLHPAVQTGDTAPPPSASADTTVVSTPTGPASPPAAAPPAPAYNADHTVVAPPGPPAAPPPEAVAVDAASTPMSSAGELTTAQMQVYDEDDEDGETEDIRADQDAASSQTAGEIVTGFDTDESIADGSLDDVLDEETPAPQKIVVDASASGRVPIGEEELEAADIFDAEAPSAQPAPQPPPAKPPEAGPATPPPVKKDAAKPPPAPKPAPRKDGPGETEAALQQLQVEREGGSAAALEKAAKEAGPPTGAWYEDTFADHYAALTRTGHPGEAKAEIEFFLQTSGLAAGAKVLDVGCGDGAHSLVLSQRGFAVTGFDASLPQLLRATQAAEALGAAAHFLHGDLRDPPVEGPFDGILCLGTTLGYFEDEDNRKAIRKLRERLAPGGRLMIQVFNRDHIVARLPARSWWQGHGCLVLDEAQMNYFTNRLQVHRTVVFEDGRQFEHNISIRAYTAHDLGSMCVDAGLRVVEISGSRLTRGRFYGATSGEIWLLVERPRT